jgi:hypothetical protein
VVKLCRLLLALTTLGVLVFGATSGLLMSSFDVDPDPDKLACDCGDKHPCPQKDGECGSNCSPNGEYTGKCTPKSLAD